MRKLGAAVCFRRMFLTDKPLVPVHLKSGLRASSGTSPQISISLVVFFVPRALALLGTFPDGGPRLFLPPPGTSLRSATSFPRPSLPPTGARNLCLEKFASNGRYLAILKFSLRSSQWASSPPSNSPRSATSFSSPPLRSAIAREFRSLSS